MSHNRLREEEKLNQSNEIKLVNHPEPRIHLNTGQTDIVIQLKVVYNSNFDKLYVVCVEVEVEFIAQTIKVDLDFSWKFENVFIF